MKRIVLTFILLTSFSVFAQDPQLFEQTWYCQNLIISGESNIPPANAEVPFVPLDFAENPLGFTTRVCNIGGGPIEFDSSNPNNFTIVEIGVTLITCNPPGGANDQFDINYFNFFVLNIADPFLYSIVTTGSSKTLTITAANGDQAIYGDQLLANPEFKATEFSIYPNPTATSLNIKTTEASPLSTLEIFDISGKRVLVASEAALATKTISVETLQNGIYFLKLENATGKRSVLKFVKQ